MKYREFYVFWYDPLVGPCMKWFDGDTAEADRDAFYDWLAKRFNIVAKT